MSPKNRRYILFFLAILTSASIVCGPCADAYGIDNALPAKLKDYFDKIQSKFGSKVELAVAIQYVDNSQPLFELNTRKLLEPASVQKMVTTLSALRTLGGGYRFPTEIFVDHLPAEISRPEDEKLPRVDFSEPVFEIGNLYMRGYGDPSLDNGRLAQLAQTVAQNGIEEINDLVMDDTLFVNAPRPISEKPHDAGLGALSANYNAYAVNISPAKLAGSATVTITAGLPFRLDNQTTAVRGTKLDVEVIQSPTSASVQALGDGANLFEALSRVHLTVRGNVGYRSEPESYFFSVPDPAAYTGCLFKYYLERVGVKVKGKLLRGETPAPAKALEVVQSKELSGILQELNHTSSNVAAGQIVYAMGQDARGVYRYELGLRRVIGTLEKLGFPDSSFEVVDGSGLDRRNRLTAEQILAVILDAYRDFSVAPDFIASLSRFGQSGTLKTRRLLSPELGDELRGEDLSKVRRKANAVWAKTGTLTGVSALAGFLETMTDERMAFVIIENGEATKDEFIEVEDALVRMLINLPEKKARITPEPEKKPVESSAGENKP